MSSCMQFFTQFIPLHATATLLAVLVACVLGGGNGKLAPTTTPEPIRAVTSTTGNSPAVDLRAASEVSQHVIVATCYAALPATEASGPTIAQPKRTLSIDKLCDLKARDIGIAGWGQAVAAGADRQALDPRSLIVLHIRLQV